MIKTPTPSEIIRSILTSLILFVVKHPLIQYFWIFPYLWLLSYLFGYWNTWITIGAITISYLIRYLAVKKGALYELLINKEKKKNSSDQRAAWLNLLIRKYWITCLPKLLEPIIDEQRVKIASKAPKYLNLQLGNIVIGKISPQIDKIITFQENSDSNYTVDCVVSFLPESSVEVIIAPYNLFQIKFIIKEFKFSGRLRTIFKLNNLFPELSTISVSFVDSPNIEVALKPNGHIDIISTPFLYHWIYDTIRLNVNNLMLFPNHLLFTMGGGDIDMDEESPITEIAIYNPTPQTKVPKGYYLVQRTSGGNYAADFNYRHEGKRVFLLYKRGGILPPITEVAIFAAGSGEFPPNGFRVIEKTIFNESANLHSGGDHNNEEFLLCYSRSPEGNPITALTLFNSEEGFQNVHEYNRVELTPSGGSANLGRDPKKTSLFLGYKGGCKSPFGFAQKDLNYEEGVLRVTLNCGRNLMIADVGGTSDPYCKIMIIKDKNFAEPVRIQQSKIIPKNLNPYWGETFYFNHVNRSDLLLVKCYDHDLVGSDDYLGMLCISLTNLVYNQSVDQWFTLQHVEHGDIRLNITAINFGMQLINNDDHRDEHHHELTNKEQNVQHQSYQSINELNNIYSSYVSKDTKSTPKAIVCSSVSPLLQISIPARDVVDKFQDVVGDAIETVGGVGLKVGEKGIKTVQAVGDIGVRAVGSFIKTITRDKSKKEYEKRCADVERELTESGEHLLTNNNINHQQQQQYSCLEGQLELKASNHITWNARYFVLKNYMLYIYRKSKSEETPKEKLKLLNASVVFLNTENVFKLTTENGNIFKIRASDEETTFRWYRALSRNIQITNEGRFRQ